MKTTGIFTTHRVVIPVKKYGEPITIIPVGDIHRSSPMCHHELWLADCKRWAERIARGERIYFIGMGDYDDLASTSERPFLSSQYLHDSSVGTLEEVYNDHIDRLCKELSFASGRFLGLLEGNHYAQFASGITSGQKMAEKLGCKYLGVSSLLRISFNKGSKRNSIDMFLHHGKGGNTQGASINNVNKMQEICQADVYLMGHNHKKQVSTTSRLYLKEGNGSLRIAEKRIILGRTGSYLKAYDEGRPSYIVDGCHGPADLGSIEIICTPTRRRLEHGEERKIELHASL